MKCEMKTCTHEAMGEMRRVSNGKAGRWRAVCGIFQDEQKNLEGVACCAEFIAIMWAIAGYAIEMRPLSEANANAITREEIEAAHKVLQRDDVRIADLIG